MTRETWAGRRVFETFDQHLKLNAETGCMEWQRSLHNRGYGQMMVRGTIVRAHRFAWERANGAIPSGLQVLHSCDNPKCVNLDHLRVGTHEENHREKQAKGRARGGGGMGNAKLTWDQAQEIRGLKQHGWTHRRLADRFGVSQALISMIVSHKLWRRERTYSASKPKRVPATKCFEAQVLRTEGGCWLWQRNKNNAGYGMITVGGKKRLAHRWSYERATGPIPEGQVIRHTCDVRLCVNPAHLIAGTQSENVRDQYRRGRR